MQRLPRAKAELLLGLALGFRITLLRSYALLGQLQPSAQLSQQPQLQPQSGQPSQQSSEQQLPPSQQPPAADVAAVDAFAPARNKPETIAKEPNNFVNI